MLSYTTHNNRLEIYGVQIDQKELQALLKNNGLKWYPPKQCRTKYNATIDKIEGIQDYNPIQKEQSNGSGADKSECGECTDDSNSHAKVIDTIKKLESENKRLQEIIDGLQKQITPFNF